jgi:O-antigen ligase
MVFNFASKEYWTEMSTATDENDGTAQERMLSWRAGWDMFLDNPLGVGGNNFQARFPEYQPEEFKRGMWGRVAHSLWFTLIPELGVFGIIIYGALLFYNVRDILYLKRLHYDRTDKELTYVHSLSNAFIASLAGYFASGTFLSVLYYPHYWYLTGMIVATTRITRGLLEERQREKDEVLGASESLKFA